MNDAPARPSPRTVPMIAAPKRRARLWWAAADHGFVTLVILFALSLPIVSHRITASDAIEYYVYDRSVYFDHNLDFTNDYDGFYERNPKGLALFKEGFIDKRNPAGHAINNGPVGSAILWSPFFVVGDLIARVFHTLGARVATDGFSLPYIWSVSVGAAIIAGVGLLLTYRLTSAITNPRAAFWASLVIWLGTPAFFYSHFAPTYAHAASWFAASAFLLVWYRTRMRRSWLAWAGLGALGGLVAMVREQDAVFLLVPVIDETLRLIPGLRRPTTIWFQDAGRTLSGGVLMGLAAIVAFTPQLIVYKTVNGVLRPSTEVSDKLHWNTPHAFDVLFNSAHGLFFWSPILVLAVIGGGLLIRRDPRLGISLATGFVLTVYLNGAFQTWTTAGSFGARRFIVCSPIFAIGLAEIFTRWGERHDSTEPQLLRWVPVLAIVAILWNGGLIVQFVKLYMDRQQLEWPLVFVNQFTDVPQHLLSDLWRLVTNPGSFYQGGNA